MALHHPPLPLFHPFFCSPCFSSAPIHFITPPLRLNRGEGRTHHERKTARWSESRCSLSSIYWLSFCVLLFLSFRITQYTIHPGREINSQGEAWELCLEVSGGKTKGTVGASGKAEQKKKKRRQEIIHNLLWRVLSQYVCIILRAVAM